MKILVVGGAGYIGFEVCKFLKSQGHDVWSLDPNNHRSVQLVSHKIRVLVDVVENVVLSPKATSTFEAIINLTGGLDDSNIWGNISMAQLLAVPYLRAANPIARFVHISTQYVYSVPEFNKERNKVSPNCNYGTTHCMAESALVSDGNAVILRFGTVWGTATFTRWDTWGNHFHRALNDQEPVEEVFPKDLICLLHIQNAVRVVDWAVRTDSPGMYNVADTIGYKEDLAAKFVGDVPITMRSRSGGISAGMNCTKLSRTGFVFDEVELCR